MSESSASEQTSAQAEAASGRASPPFLVRALRFCTVVFLGALVGVAAFYLLRKLG